MSNVRNVPGPAFRSAVSSVLHMLTLLSASVAACCKPYNVPLNNPGIVNGSTAGNLQTGNATDFEIAGVLYTKAATDDLWDLSGETDTDGSSYRAYWLYLDSSGTASFVASEDSASASAALETLPALDRTKSAVGVYVAGLSTDFDDAGGLAAQGTIYNGRPQAALTLTKSASPVMDGGTAGNLRHDGLTWTDGLSGEVHVASADDVWDLSGETDTTALQTRAYFLLMATDGTGTFIASDTFTGTDLPDAQAQVLAYLASDAALTTVLDSVYANSTVLVGVIVAAGVVDFDNAGGLIPQSTVSISQGTIALGPQRQFRLIAP